MVSEHKTFCRICESFCGLVASVEDGELVKLRPDPDHPLTRGYACPKGIAMLDVQNDADRLLSPMKRRADGSGFDPVSWDEALDDIGTRLKRIMSEHGNDALGWYEGNPAFFSYSHFIWTKGFLDAVGTPHYYWPGSQDANNRFAASALLYGTPANTPFPDVSRTKFLIIVGGNPLVSHGSALSVPRIKDHLHRIVDEGGRVVVVDPRRSETARAFEHVPIHPDTDAYMLLAMHQVIFEEGLVDRAWTAQWTEGIETLEMLSRPYTPEAVAERTGIPAGTIRQLARDFATADAAAAYGRTGSCLGRFATLVAFLLDTLNIISGKLDRPGGAIFGRVPFPVDLLTDLTGLSSFDRKRSRIGNYPDVFGTLPAAIMAKEIMTPGKGQIRALVVGAGNPVSSVPNGPELERAMQQLELMVSMDLYVTETNRHADYILPTTTFLERDDAPPILSLGWYTTPFMHYVGPAVTRRGDVREEWEILEAIGRRIGIVPSSIAPIRWLGRIGIHVSPQFLLDAAFRIGPEGDRFGLRRRGLNLKKLQRDAPSGKVLREHQPTGRIKKVIRHKSGRIPLAPAVMVSEIHRLAGSLEHDPAFPVRMIGLRELRSHNSWMHNSQLLMRGGRTHAFRVHPDDAERYGLTDGEPATVTSRTGTITTTVKVTDEMIPGTIAMPHGWGHQGLWRLAVAAGGASSNTLASSELEDLERVMGHSVLNGIPVRLAPVTTGTAAGAAEPAAELSATAPR
jgi:anaerobic selenocysteine-containing dehydrogenase